MDDVVISLSPSLLFGIVCAIIAHSRGRSPVGWFLIGLLLACFALILLLVLPDLNAEQAQHGQLSREQRKLRQLMEHERHVAEARHRVSTERLEAHDQALGMDTSPPPMPELAARDAAALAGDAAAAFAQTEWFYIADAQQCGPVPFAELAQLWHKHQIGPESYVWREGMPEWLRLQEIQGLPEALRA